MGRIAMLEVIDDGKLEGAARSAASALADPDSNIKVGWADWPASQVCGAVNASLDTDN